MSDLELFHSPLNRRDMAILYVRVSTTQQRNQGWSLEDQEDALEEAAFNYGYTEMVTIVEDGKSGRDTSKRPGITEAMSLLASGEASALFVTKIDRLARNTVDALTIVDAASNQGWRLVSLDLPLDPMTPDGRYMLTMWAANAELELSRIADRHREWHKYSRLRGGVWGVNIGPQQEVPADVEARIMDEHYSGKSLREIARVLNDEGIPTPRSGKWHASSVKHVIARVERRAS